MATPQEGYILTLTFDSYNENDPNNITPCRKTIDLLLNSQLQLIMPVTLDTADCQLNVGQNQIKHLLLINRFRNTNTTTSSSTNTNDTTNIDFNELSQVALRQLPTGITDIAIVTDIKYKSKTQ